MKKPAIFYIYGFQSKDINYKRDFAFCTIFIFNIFSLYQV